VAPVTDGARPPYGDALRLALTACLLLSATTLGREPPTRRPAKAQHHRWKCTFQGRVVFCDLLDHPLSTSRWKEDQVVLLEREPPRFEPLAAPPASFR